MACEVCQHCDTYVEPGEGTMLDGYSYHQHCRKCYVCGETDLHNAETFRGVIFCTSCSQRIFQGCSTARQAKTKHRSPRHQARRRRLKNTDAVPELTQISGAPDTNSEPSSNDTKKTKLHKKDKIYTKDLKKNSTEIGTTTNVTQEILKLAKHPEAPHVATHAKPRKKRKIHKMKQNKNDCSDLRIAELGASVEIAHMTLRKQSEVPVIIKSGTHVKRTKSLSVSSLNQKTNMLGDSYDKWTDSAYSSDEDSEEVHWTQRRFKSILKIPFKCFKRNILDRSSLVSILMSSTSYSNCPLSFRTLLNQEIVEHHRRGLKKLYSTINRSKSPCRMGWMSSNANVSKPQRPKYAYGKRCKHFETSHSYRCMRDQVMRLAGPTRSELAIYRKQITDILSPTFVKKIINYNKHYACILATAGKVH